MAKMVLSWIPLVIVVMVIAAAQPAASADDSLDFAGLISRLNLTAAETSAFSLIAAPCLLRTSSSGDIQCLSAFTGDLQVAALSALTAGAAAPAINFKPDWCPPVCQSGITATIECVKNAGTNLTVTRQVTVNTTLDDAVKKLSAYCSNPTTPKPSDTATCNYTQVQANIKTCSLSAVNTSCNGAVTLPRLGQNPGSKSITDGPLSGLNITEAQAAALDEICKPSSSCGTAVADTITCFLSTTTCNKLTSDSKFKLTNLTTTLCPLYQASLSSTASPPPAGGSGSSIRATMGHVALGFIFAPLVLAFAA